MSQEKDQEYLTDGISEELLNVLARVEGFKVTGRTSAFAFKGRDEDLRAIGQKLGVENILEGSVRKQGDRIRVTAQLVKAADGYHLWSETYDRQLGDVFAIQDDIAQQVVDAVRTKLTAAVPSRAASQPAPPPTDNVEAYTHFLRGQQLLRGREGVGMQAALLEFEEAVALDPDFARARVGMGNSLVLLASYGMRDIPAIEKRASTEFERALSIEPGLPEAYAGQALLLSIKAQSAPSSYRCSSAPWPATRAIHKRWSGWDGPMASKAGRRTNCEFLNAPTRLIHWRRSFSSITHSSARYADIGVRPSGW